MASDFVTALKGVLDRLDELAASDADLRARLRALACAFLQATEEPEQTSPPRPVQPAPVPPPVAPPEPTPALVAPPAPAPVQNLRPTQPPVERTLSPSVVSPALTRPANGPPAEGRPFFTPADEVDLTLVATRCRLKAEAARLAAARFGWAGETEVPDSGDSDSEHDLIARARGLPDCFLWMLHDCAPAAAPAKYLTLAGCYETAALAADLLRELTEAASVGKDLFAPAAAVVAEAQSAFRVAVSSLGRRFDPDQVQLFRRLRDEATERQVYINRFMRADDPADPANWAKVRDRLDSLREQLRGVRERARRREKLLDKISYHAGRLATAPADDLSDWSRIIETTDELVRGGLPPSSLELRERLLPLLDRLPESLDFPEGFQRVLRELDRYLASRPTEAEPEVSGPLSDEVRRAASLLRGRAAVLIGGSRRPYAAEALSRALGLSELIWLDGTFSSSYFAFEPYVARPDVAVVLLAIRWSSHGFAEVKEFCDRFGKPLVRLPAGYSPNQVAYHILSQTSGKLAPPSGRKDEG